MKKSFMHIFFTVLLFGCIAFSQITLAQAPPPPPAEKGTNDNKGPGGGAPIDNGIYLTVALIAGFGAWKMYKRLQKMKS